MKTDELLELLVTQAGPAPKSQAFRLIAPVAFLGAALAGLLAVEGLGLIPKTMFSHQAFWMKIIYALAVAITSGTMLARLCKPGVPLGPGSFVLPILFLCMVGMACVVFFNTPPVNQKTALFGHSWLVCPWIVVLLSLPALLGGLLASRELAPTRPRLTGAVCGLLAGSVGALGYAWACTETGVAFVAVWYSLGIALSGLLGLILGPRVLRW